MNIRYTADPDTAVSVSIPPSTCPPSSSREDDSPPPPIKVRASVFFDGTGNNMFNTHRRTSGGERFAWMDSFNGSFMNDYSNVAKLANYLITESAEDDYHFSVYVEGIGTLYGDGDDINGSGRGAGERGITTRVLRAMDRIASAIPSLDVNNSRSITKFNIDTFGFSRGAACSRHFGYRIFQYYGRIDSESRPLIVRIRDNGFSLPEGATRIKFMGLFDTVSSFGSEGDHHNDVRELNLNFSDYLGQIDKIVHIAAAEEFRRNFRLTNCRSAGRIAQTIFLPGVHSDIGGGYTNNVNELNFKVFEIPHSIAADGDGIWPIQKSYIELMVELIRKGNFRESELVNGSLVMPFVRGERNLATERTFPYIGSAVTANRTNISNRYARVALKIMAEKFTDASLRLDSTFEGHETLGVFLNEIFPILNNNTHSADFWINATDRDCGFDIGRLRHDYIHTSSQYNDNYIIVGYAMRAQWYRNSSYVELNEDTIGNGLGFKRKRMVNTG